MPKFAPNTPRAERKFSGLDFTVPYVFAEGHALSKPEAAWLNSNLASVVGNAFSGDIRRGLKAYNDKARAELSKAEVKNYVDVEDPAVLGWDMQAEFDAKFADYVLGESNRGSGGGAASPVDQLIRMFSTVDVKARLAKKGLKVGPLYKAPSNMKDEAGEPLYPSKWEELVQENMKAKLEQFTAQATEQLANLAAGDDEGDELLAGLGGDEATTDTTGEAEDEAA